MQLSDKRISIIITVCIVTISLAVYFFDPRKYIIAVPCFFHYFTGLYCPACGGLRASYCLAHFEIANALKYNLLIIFFLAGIFYYLIREIIFLISGRYLPHISKNILIAFFVIVIVFCIIRNLHFEPFTHLFAFPS